MFYFAAEADEAIRIIEKDDEDEEFPSSDDFFLYYARAVNTLRELLVTELGMPKVYERYLQIAKSLDVPDCRLLLQACSKLLQGRKTLGQLLAILCERNR